MQIDQTDKQPISKQKQQQSHKLVTANSQEHRRTTGWLGDWKNIFKSYLQMVEVFRTI